MAYLAESGVSRGVAEVESAQEVLTTAGVVEAMRGANAELDTADERTKALIHTAVADVDRFARTGDKKAFEENCLDALEDLPLTDAAAKKLDSRLYQLAMESLQRPLITPEQKRTAHAMTLLSQSFAVKTQAKEKVERVMEEFKIAAKGEFKSQKDRELALQTYLAVAELKLELRKPDDTSNNTDMRDNLQVRRAQTVAKELEKASGLKGKKMIGQVAAGAAGVAVMVAGPAGAAAASELSVAKSNTSQSEQSTVTIAAENELEADAVQPTFIQVSPVQGGESSAVVIVQQPEDEAAEFPEMHVPIQLVSTDSVTESAVIIQEPESEQTELSETVVTLVPVQQPAEIAEGETVTEATPEAVVVVAEPAVAEESEAPAPPVEVQVAPQPESTGPAESDEPIVVTEAEGVVPDANPNPKEGETTEQTIDRLAQSRDMDMTTYKILTTYSPGYEASKDEYLNTLIPPNATLDKWIKDKRDTLVESITEAAHDEDYTHKAILAIAYLNAAQKDPSILEHEEVQGFIVVLPDMGEEYEDKLYAKYLGRAEKLLASEDYGSGEGFDKETKAALAMLYAYVDLAQLDGAAQTEKIDEIKAAEEAERKRQEEEQRRQEAERQRQEAEQQGLEEIEIIAADKEQLVLTAIERARANGEITDKYAAVLTLVIQIEGPDALIAGSGMVGNCMAEAAGCDPGVEEYVNGIGFGIFQWSFERRDALEAAAERLGVSVSDLEFQVRYAIEESKRRTQRSGTGNEWAGMLESDSAGAAAEYWRWNFERPREIPESTDIRIRVAKEVHAAVSGQMKAINKEAKQAAEDRKAAEEAARKKAEEEAARKKAEEEERHRKEHEGDIRHELADGKAIKVELMDEYNDISGKLPSSELASTPGLNQDGKKITVVLQPEAMKGYKALAKAFKEEFGKELQLTDSYRDYDTQVYLKKIKPILAGAPGTSNHGWGLALDLDSHINEENRKGKGTKEHEWMEANAWKYGFVNPSWAHSDGAKHEPWHWEFIGSLAERWMSEDD